MDLIKSSTTLSAIDFHSQIGSTNDRGIELIRNSQLAPPILVLTETQTAGRGQRAHKWWSGAGSLTFSYIVEKSGQENLRPIATAVSIAECLEYSSNLSGVQIKWPNDVLVNGKKIAGILIESITQNQKTFLVIGIGINVNNQVIDSDQLESLDKRPANIEPTSILAETGLSTSLNDLLIDLVNRISESPDIGLTIRNANARLAFQNLPIVVKQPGFPEFDATCVCLNTDGHLEIIKRGKPIILSSGSIRPF